MKKSILIIVCMTLLSTISLASSELMAQIADFKININSKSYNPKNDIIVINDRTYLPLREMAELVGYDVEFSQEFKTIELKKKSATDLYPFDMSHGKSNTSSLETPDWGYEDSNGNIVIEPQYYSAGSFVNGIASVRGGENMRSYYINENGDKLFDKDFAYAKDFCSGYAAVTLNGTYPPSYEEYNWGFIDITGDIVSREVYSDIKSDAFLYGYAIVKNFNGLWGVIDRNFNNVVEYKYDDVFIADNECIAVKENGKWKYKNLEENDIITQKFDDCTFFSDGLAAVCIDGKWGYIDIKGNIVFDFEYFEASPFVEGRAQVTTDSDECLCIDKNGNILYDNIEDIKDPYYDDKIIKAQSGTKKGLLDNTYQPISDFIYDDIRNLHEGMMAVCIQNKWGYINTCGELTVPVVYDSASRFRDGKAEVTQGVETFYINTCGQRIDAEN